ncbi:MAG: hypothetical protein C0613_09930 [Desulfobulbaceae bacterium]|nr:MAG: hypothetical protein C0613_09930 [Desulfobulbaceae bacterium]
MISSFTDGNTIFRGLVANISEGGLKITNITARFRPAPQQYATIVTNRDRKFKLNLLPVWFEQCDQRVTVGFEIVAPSPDWHNYIDTMLNRSAQSC